jgi:hypothetical protein
MNDLLLCAHAYTFHILRSYFLVIVACKLNFTYSTPTQKLGKNISPIGFSLGAIG